MALRKNLLTIILMSLFFVGCTSEKQLTEKVKKIMKENPDILTEAIKANPADFVEAIQEAAKGAREEMAARREKGEKQKFDESFNNPLKPVVRSDESIRGTKGAPIVVIEYSDFECPFCSRGFDVVTELLGKYKGKVQFVYKHLPLSFHKQAMIASQYYEAIRLQSAEKAFKFHDDIFANQSKLKNGEKFLQSLAKKLNLNMGKLKRDIGSDQVKKRIAEDMKEAAKFGIQGTPGFIVNGIPVKGAYPFSHFEMIINKLKEKGKIKL
jgi:protein-disulfide isomerase